MSKEAMKLALEALELNNDEWKSLADSGDSGYWKAEDQDHYQQTNKAIAALREALAEQPAQQALDKMAENARELGLDYEPAQQEPIDQLIHAWQAIEETSGHVLDEGDVEGRMHMSVIRSAWEQMDSLVREIWDERGRP